ncbi:MAG: SprT family zinc-dependent metalloprotease [Burkholderiales bacterium]|nr:SprT family zinc-dependent metalloprotease [Burkholderiales bacterium]
MPEQLSLFGTRVCADGARRVARLGARWIEYRFARRRRRTIAIVVDGTGLAVSAPLKAAWRDIDAFLLEKQDWILARLDEWAAVPRAVPVLGLDGDVLPVLGERVTLDVAAGRSVVSREGDRLRIRTPAPQASHRVVALLLGWLRAQALATLAPRTAALAAHLGRSAPTVEISRAERQWGVCSARGAIRYSWRLVHLEPALTDYVVAHEVAHLVELNHSKRFWRVVESLYPDWREARVRLEREGAALPLIGRPS